MSPNKKSKRYLRSRRQELKNESSSIYSPFFQRTTTTTSPLEEDAQIERELTRRKVVMDNAKWEHVIQMLRASNLHTHVAVQQALNGRIMANIAQEIKKETDLENDSEENTSDEENRIIEETSWFNGILGKRIIGRGKSYDEYKLKMDNGPSHVLINELNKVENEKPRRIFKRQNSNSSIGALDLKPKSIFKAPKSASLDHTKKSSSYTSLHDLDDESNISSRQQSSPLHEIDNYNLSQQQRLQSPLFNDENKKIPKRQLKPQDPPFHEDNDRGRRILPRNNSFSSLSTFLGVKHEKDTTQNDAYDSCDEKSASNNRSNNIVDRFNFFSKTNTRKTSFGNEYENDIIASNTETKQITRSDMLSGQSICNDTNSLSDHLHHEQNHDNINKDTPVKSNDISKQIDDHEDNTNAKIDTNKPKMYPQHSIARIQELTGTKSTGSWIKMQERMLKKKDLQEIKNDSKNNKENNHIEEPSNENTLDMVNTVLNDDNSCAKIDKSMESKKTKITSHVDNNINDENIKQNTICSEVYDIYSDKSESANSGLDTNNHSDKTDQSESVNIVLDTNNHSDKSELTNTISDADNHSVKSDVTKETNNLFDDDCYPYKSDKSEVTKETISTKNSPQVSSIEGEFFDEGWRLRDSIEPEDDCFVSTDSNESVTKNHSLATKSGKIDNTSNITVNSTLNEVNNMSNKIFVESYDSEQISSFFSKAAQLTSESKDDEKDFDESSRQNDNGDNGKKKNGKITNALRKFSLNSNTKVNEENINLQKIEKNIVDFNNYQKRNQTRSSNVKVSKGLQNRLQIEWLDRDTKNDGKLTEAIRRRLDPNYVKDKNKGKKRIKSRSNDLPIRDKPSIFKRSSFQDYETMKDKDKKNMNPTRFRKFSLESSLGPRTKVAIPLSASLRQHRMLQKPDNSKSHRSSLSTKNKKQSTQTSKSGTVETNAATKSIDSSNISVSQRQKIITLGKNSKVLTYETSNKNPDNASNIKNEKKISFAPLGKRIKGEISRDTFKRFSLGSAISSKKNDSLDTGRRTTMPTENELRNYHGRKQVTFLNENDSIMDKLSLLSKPDYDPKKDSSHNQINLRALANIEICSETGAEIHDDDETSTITAYSRVNTLDFCKGNSTRLKETLFANEDWAVPQGKKAHDVKLDASQYLNEMSKYQQHSARSLFSSFPN